MAIRTGKPRSLLMIIFLSIITFSIYSYVYHFLVALELKRMTGWTAEDKYRPTVYIWTFAIVIGITIIYSAFSFVSQLALGLGGMGMVEPQDMTVGLVGYMAVSTILSMGLGVAEVFLVYYFLRLNDYAATKVGLESAGIFRPMALYVLTIVVTIVGVFAVIGTAVFQGIFRGTPDVSSILTIVFSMFWVFLFVFGIYLYYLYERTKMVNRIWLEGRFEDTAPTIAPALPLTPGEAPRPSGLFE